MQHRTYVWCRKRERRGRVSCAQWPPKKKRGSAADRNIYIICNGDVGKRKIFPAYKYVCLHRGDPVVNVRNEVQNR